MDEDQRRKLLFYATLLGLVFVIAFSFYMSYQARYFNSQVGGLASQIDTIKQQKFQQPKNGLDGYTPKFGIDYFNGIDGKNGRNGKDSVSTNTIIQQPIYTNIPVPGDAGKNGKNARQIELCYVTEGVIGQRFVGSEDCNPIEGP